MGERKKSGFEESSDLVEVLSIAMEWINGSNKNANVDYNSNEVEERVDGELVDGVEFGALEWEGACKGESEDKDRVDKVRVLGSEQLFTRVNK